MALSDDIEAADLDVFFDTEEFALSAALTPLGGVPRTIIVIFDNDYQELTMQGATVSGSTPVARCKTADVIGVLRRSRIVIKSVEYFINDIQHTGRGTSLLILSED